MSKGQGLLFIGLLFILLTACASQPLSVTHQPETLRIVTSDACGPLMEELAAAYQKVRPWVTVRVEVFDAAVAEERLRAGAADLAVLPWPGDAISSLWAVPFATDAVAVIVHPDVPAEGLSLAQLREVFRGRVGEWADGAFIQVVSREAGAGVRSVFEAVVMDGHDVTLTALVVPDTAAAVEAVATIPGAIGYVSLGRLEDGVRVLSLEGRSPRLGALGDYPLAYSVFLVAPSEPAGEARVFVQWVLGPQGQQWVTRRFGLPP
ncbi:MAG TPA: hypothetical protein ENI37_06845 [Chloroflexi bacterium]|nr:hypothetical protein [Chloroflexota bacterium]